jgi:hypothetical protein
MADNKSNVVEEDDSGNMEESENEEGFSWLVGGAPQE